MLAVQLAAPASPGMIAMKLPPEDMKQLDRFLDRLKHDAELEIGYPVAFDFDYSALTPFLSFSLNNAGDPFMPMTYLLNSHDFEQEVVAFFAGLARAPLDKWWGYVTNGSTEGNLYGLYLARDCCRTASSTSRRTVITAWARTCTF